MTQCDNVSVAYVNAFNVNALASILKAIWIDYIDKEQPLKSYSSTQILRHYFMVFRVCNKKTKNFVMKT